MSASRVTIVDYQMGNLRSVQKALEHVGVEATISNDANEIANADRLILPGVGAFRDAIREIKTRDLVRPIKDFIASGRPFLGICLGLQLLFEVSEEGGQYEGLGVLAGRVVRFELPAEYKVPHMGWNRVKQEQVGVPAFAGLPADAYFYFVHSYYVRPDDASVCWLTSDYGGAFCAAVARDNVIATQFHPEKSQTHGLRLLENFSRIGAYDRSLSAG